MSCNHESLCFQCINEQAKAFKRKYYISAQTEKQIVAMSEHVPPLPEEPSEDWLERLYRAWYYARC